MNTIEQGVCTSYLLALAQAQMNLSTTTTQVFRVALYTANAVLSPDTSTYITEGEIPSTGGYTAGGIVLTFANYASATGRVVTASFNNAIWPAATISAAGALIYNATTNVAIAVLDFGGTKSTNGTDFVVRMPANLPTTALLRLQGGAKEIQ